MVLLMGINFPENKIVKGVLESFYGIGPQVSSKILARHFIHPWAKIGSLSNRKLTDLSNDVSTMPIENELRRKLQEDIRRLRDIGTYRGRRHAMALPVRGQSTRSGGNNTARKLNRVERKG